jgi:hypothetical protein
MFALLHAANPNFSPTDAVASMTKVDIFLGKPFLGATSAGRF